MHRRTPVFFKQGQVLVWVRCGTRRDGVPMYQQGRPVKGKILSVPSRNDYVTLMAGQRPEEQGKIL